MGSAGGEDNGKRDDPEVCGSDNVLISWIFSVLGGVWVGGDGGEETGGDMGGGVEEIGIGVFGGGYADGRDFGGEALGGGDCGGVDFGGGDCGCGDFGGGDCGGGDFGGDCGGEDSGGGACGGGDFEGGNIGGGDVGEGDFGGVLGE